MIIHSYLTNGFHPWAKLFLESYKYHNGEDTKIIFSTRELNTIQINELYSIYKNLNIDNQTFDMESMAKKAKISLNKLVEYKRQIEEEHVTQQNKIWKLMIAADDRVKSILELVKKQKNEDYILHFDIDMYIRSNLKELKQFIRNNDISIRLRLKSKPNRKTLISVQGYKICQPSIDFLSSWIKYVDDITPSKRPLGYGQTSCWYAYRDFKNKVKWGDIAKKFAAPQMNQNDVIWSGNTEKGKTENLRLYYEDFNKMRGLKNDS